MNFTGYSDHNSGNLLEKKKIVFFDGVCGLCNEFVNFLLKKDRRDILLYAPLQGEIAKKYIQNMDVSDLKTIIFYSEGKPLTKSDAVIEIFKSIGGIWQLVAVLQFIPRRLRDYCYDVVANNRIKWFGYKKTCRIPTERERSKLLI